MSFHEIRFPVALSRGATGGVLRRTEIVPLVNGREERNGPWAHSRRRYDAGRGLRSIADLDRLLAFFEARRGMLYGFRWTDWLDHLSCAPGQTPGATDQVIGTGDGGATMFQLSKTYSDAGGSYTRPISKPLEGSVVVAVDGTAADFTLDATTGALTLTSAPPSGSTITAGFEFDVPVRFDLDAIEVTLSDFQAGEVPSVPVIEVRV